MKSQPIIEKIELHEFAWDLQDIGTGPVGAIPTYAPGEKLHHVQVAVRVHTSAGVTGEFAGGWGAATGAALRGLAGYLIGKNALERELINKDMKLYFSSLGVGIVDVVLWDIAGKYYEAPIYELLGGYRRKLPCYASTMNGALSGPLSTPESFADFAEQCLELGYPAFKIHPYPTGPVARHVAAVHAVGKRVGGRMDLMIDPFCFYETFAEALKVGQACDDERFFWWEDPYRDGGVSHFAHRKLRELVKTPLLQGEKVRGLEQHVDFMVSNATDFIRGDPVPDGITTTMKVAHAAEGLGLDIEMHGSGPAQRHAMAAARNSNYYEMVWVHPDVPSTAPPIYKDGYEDGLYAIDSDGCVPVPEGPGLGVEYDWDFIMKHRTDGAEYTA